MKKQPILLTKTHIVGVIACRDDLTIALETPSIADIYEWRVDCFPGSGIEDDLRRLKKPIVITVRDSSEGGYQSWWGTQDYRERYQRYLSLASFIDIEAVNAGYYLSDVVGEAKSRGIGVIISQHVLKEPWTPELTERAAQVCAQSEGDIFKVAIRPDSFGQLSTFIGFLPELAKRQAFQIAPMAMGEKFGKISRLLFALGGSPLVYTYLSKPQVKGQWGAMEFRKELAKFQ